MQHDQVTRFLLGELPEGEMQRIAAAVRTDDTFRQRVRVVEDDLIEGFIHGRLKGDDLMRFRRFFLVQPERRERVKIAQGFLDDPALAQEANQAPPTRWQRWRQKLFGQPAKDQARDTTKPSAWQNVWDAIYEPLKIGTFAFALLAGVICFWLLVEYLQLRYDNARGQAEIAQAREATAALNAELAQQQTTTDSAEEKIRRLREQLNQTRAAALPISETPAAVGSTPYSALSLQPTERNSNEKLIEVVMPTGAEDLLFQLDLGRDANPSYRVELRAQSDGQKIWESGTLKARTKEARRVIEVRIPAALLTPRQYMLKALGNTAGTLATGATSPAESLTYSFRVKAS